MNPALIVTSLNMKTKKPKLGSGARFKAVAKSAAKSYLKKGVAPKKAAKIGAAIAAKAGMKKYGKAKMTKLAKKGKK